MTPFGKESFQALFSLALVVGSVGTLVPICESAHAEVLEYSDEGELSRLNGSIITGSTSKVFDEKRSGSVALSDPEIPVPTRRPTNPTFARNDVAELAQEVALEYSSSNGVRKAGLSALQFVRLFDALIFSESNYNPDAVSPKGAKGMGQLMPDTIEELGVKDPFDPKENLQASAEYLTRLLDRFGTVELALAGYNAGPTRVASLGKVPQFEETRAYIHEIFKKADLGAPVMAGAESVSTALIVDEPSVKGDPSDVKQTQKDEEKPLIGDVTVWEF